MGKPEIFWVLAKMRFCEQ